MATSSWSRRFGEAEDGRVDKGWRLLGQRAFDARFLSRDRERSRELSGTARGRDVCGRSVRLGAGLEIGLDDVKVLDQVGGDIVGWHMVARLREEDVFQGQCLASNNVGDTAYQNCTGRLQQSDADGHTNKVGHDVWC